jgi:tRNA pseudouridine55 synthase
MIKLAKQLEISSGLIPLLKPKGISSSQAVQKLKKRLGFSKIGHTGTLDPEASGVLVVVVGGATKIIPYIGSWEKEYVASAVLGIETDTDDLSGEVISKSGENDPGRQAVEKGLNTFKGNIKQLPPVFSAKKFKGKPHYEYARNGVEVERKAATVFVRHMELLSYKWPEVTFKVVCSMGTYIRSICRDLGKLLGTGCSMKDLKRTMDGPYMISDCVELGELLEEEKDPGQIIKRLDHKLFRFKALAVDTSFEEIMKNGGLIYADSLSSKSDDLEKGEIVSIYNDDEVLGIFETLYDFRGNESCNGHEKILRAKRIFN